MTAAITPGREMPENADERRMFDAACETMSLTPLQWIADTLIMERNMTSVAGASYGGQRTIAYNELQRAAARLAAKPADEEVQKLLDRLDYLKIDCEAWARVSGLEAAEVRAARNIVIRLGNIRDDLAALFPTEAPKP